MKKNKPKYLTLYYEWAQSKKLPCRWGLCREFEPFYAPNDHPLFKLIKPTGRDKRNLRKYGFTDEYWGSDSVGCMFGEFTPLRQNLVLLMAALNNEL